MSAASVHRVLVFSNEPVIAALVGILIEVAGRTPVFAHPGESEMDALERLRPLSVVLIDVTLGASHSDLFFAAAAKFGIGVAISGPEMCSREIAEIASTRNVPWFTMPPTAEQLAIALDVAGKRIRRERSAERRSGVETTIASDGTRILLDRTGQRWMVYDRRASDRRRDAVSNLSRDPARGSSPGGVGIPDAATTRVFVSDAGETRRCALDELEVRQASASALELQLERASAD